MESGFLGLQWKYSSQQKNKNAFNDSGKQFSSWTKDLAYTLPKAANNYQEDISSIQRTSTSLHEAINSPASSFPLFTLPAFDSNANINNPSPVPVLIPKKQSTWKFPFMYESVPLLGTLASPSNNDLRPSNAGGQLTIFYANDVYVYEDVTPRQVERIMGLAKTGSSKKKQAAGDEELHHSKQQRPDPSPAATSGSQQTSTTYTGATVPQARKATLERFLHKRKNRLNKWMPYNSMQKKPCVCFDVEIDLESFPARHEC